MIIEPSLLKITVIIFSPNVGFTLWDSKRILSNSSFIRKSSSIVQLNHFLIFILKEKGRLTSILGEGEDLKNISIADLSPNRK